jgi:serine/threonine protein kinase
MARKQTSRACSTLIISIYSALSFVKGHALWIVMEYLAGGSCLDLVRVPRSIVMALLD